VSLFSNCGAGDLGYARAGFQFEVMAEIDPRRLQVALGNHPTAVGVPGDLRDTWKDVVSRYEARARGAQLSLLAACPPCQGMSPARTGKGYLDDGSQDERNLLVEVIARVAKKLRPRLIVVENVPHFFTRVVPDPRTGNPIVAAVLLREWLSKAYDAFPCIVDLADYGIPQTRRRAFMTFVSKDEPRLSKLASQGLAPYPKPTRALDHGGAGHVTLEAALEGLGAPPLDARSDSTAYDRANPMHAVPVWSDRRYEMVAAIPPGSGRSAWENDECSKCGRKRIVVTVATCPRCRAPLPRPILKAKNGAYRLIRGFPQSYRRMAPTEPAPTITTATGHVGSHTTIHPRENRLLSPWECAHLQTFPHSFRWGNALEEWGQTNVREMIGEAVPPAFTKLHGHALLGLLRSRWAVPMLSAKDRRCHRAEAVLRIAQRDA
jgi:DNA (cytosine-5)-methyltransferase 1